MGRVLQWETKEEHPKQWERNDAPQKEAKETEIEKEHHPLVVSQRKKHELETELQPWQRKELLET